MSLQNSTDRAQGVALIAANFPIVAFYGVLLVLAIGQVR